VAPTILRRLTLNYERFPSRLGVARRSAFKKGEKSYSRITSSSKKRSSLDSNGRKESPERNRTPQREGVLEVSFVDLEGNAMSTSFPPAEEGAGRKNTGRFIDMEERREAIFV